MYTNLHRTSPKNNFFINTIAFLMTYRQRQTVEHKNRYLFIVFTCGSHNVPHTQVFKLKIYLKVSVD